MMLHRYYLCYLLAHATQADVAFDMRFSNLPPFAASANSTALQEAAAALLESNLHDIQVVAVGPLIPVIPIPSSVSLIDTETSFLQVKGIRRFLCQKKTLVKLKAHLNAMSGFKFLGSLASTGNDKDPLHIATSSTPHADAEEGDVALSLSCPTSELDPNSVDGEGYTLSTSAKRGVVMICAVQVVGLFYGLQTLLQLTSGASGSIPAVAITDSPRFGWRGCMLDVARHFHPVSTVLRLVSPLFLSLSPSPHCPPPLSLLSFSQVNRDPKQLQDECPSPTPE
jgi:hypothetical protein